MKTKLMVLAVLLLSGCGLTDSALPKGQVEVEVTSVIDGDTIKVIYEEKETTVRYLLIDTPETNHPEFGEQPLGKEATEENKSLIDSGNVTIEFDSGERFDDYGRMLAYIYVDGESVQEHLLEEGLARVAYVFPPNTRYLDEFEAAEKQAKNEQAGIWEYEGYSNDRGFQPDAVPNWSGSEENCRIKGNINRSGDKIYHMPGSSSYEQTNPEEWFCTEQEAQEAGFRGVNQ